MDGEQLEILKELVVAVVPLGVLTVVVLAVILFGIMHCDRIGGGGCARRDVSGGHGQVSAPGLVVESRRGDYRRASLGGPRGDFVSLLVSGSLGATFVGDPRTRAAESQNLAGAPAEHQGSRRSSRRRRRPWSAGCSSARRFSPRVFALHGGQSLIERWVLSMNLSPVGFLFISQMIIFLLGWPLEWTEIIVIFCPIFIPLLSHFQIDPILFGTMVAVNLQAAFLSPPVAMSAFYLKGVAPKHVTLNQIFAGMMPYMIIVCYLPCVHVRLAGHDAVAAGVSIRQLVP